MNRTVIFKNIIDIDEIENQKMQKRYKDRNYYFDDDIDSTKKNQKLGKLK